MFVAQNLPHDVLLAGTTMGTLATYFPKTPSLGTVHRYVFVVVLVDIFFKTAQSFYYFTYFQFVSSNLNMQQIIHIVFKTVRRYCIGYRSTFVNFISIPTIICFNLNDGGNACVRYITNVTFMMLITMSSSIT